MSTENKFKCIFCKDEFDDKESLQVHFRKHGNKDFNDSVNAAKRKSSKVAIMKKEASCSDEADGGSIVKCDVCTAEFDTVAKAICHKHKVHKDDRIKHFCPWCGKQFPIKHLWDNHMDSHEEEKIPEETLLCDHCNFEFYTSSALSYHTNSFHRQEVLAVQLTNIPMASKQVKIVNKETLSIYYCHLCGQDYLQKFALQKHITTNHPEADSSESFPEDMLRCALCDAFFFNKPAYETHLMCHTHDDIYIGNESEREALLQDENFKIETLPPNEEKFDENILINSGKKVERLVSDLDPNDFLTNEDEENSSNSSSEELDDEDSDDMSQENSDEAKSEPPEEQRKAITLDEFFTMNKDVFGEISGFQGVVEVPSQVINNRLNRAIRKPVPVRKVNKKPPPKLTQGAKIISFDSFQKLRQQGLVIKQPKAQASNVRRLNTIIPINKKIQQINSINKPNVIPVVKTINKSVDVRTARIHPSINQVGIKIHGNIQSKQMFKSMLNKEGLATIKKINDTSKSSNFPIVKMASNVATTQKKEASPVMKKMMDPKNGTIEETQIKNKPTVSKPSVSIPNKDGVTIVKKIVTDGSVDKKLPLPINKISEVIKPQNPETVAALKKHGNIISLNADTVTILKKLSSGDNSAVMKEAPASKAEMVSVTKSMAEDGDEFAHSDDSFMSDGADFSDDFDDDDLDNLGVPTNIKITNIPIKNPISIINKMPLQKPIAKAIQDASKEMVPKIITGPASKKQNMKSVISVNKEFAIRKRPHSTPISELKAATEPNPSPPKRRIVSPTFQDSNEDVDSDFSDDIESDNMMEVTRIPVKMPTMVKAAPSISKTNVTPAIAKPSMPASKSNVPSAAKANIVPLTLKSNVVPSPAKPNIVLSSTKTNIVPSAAKADLKKTMNLDVLEKLRKQGLISVVKKPKDDDSQLTSGDSNCLTVKSGG